MGVCRAQRFSLSLGVLFIFCWIFLINYGSDISYVKTEVSFLIRCAIVVIFSFLFLLINFSDKNIIYGGMAIKVGSDRISRALKCSSRAARLLFFTSAVGCSVVFSWTSIYFSAIAVDVFAKSKFSQLYRVVEIDSIAGRGSKNLYDIKVARFQSGAEESFNFYDAKGDIYNYRPGVFLCATGRSLGYFGVVLDELNSDINQCIRNPAKSF